MRQEGKDVEEISERMNFQRRFSDSIRDFKKNRDKYLDASLDDTSEVLPIKEAIRQY